MKFVLVEKRHFENTALNKAPDDVMRVAESLGFVRLMVNACRPHGKSIVHRVLARVAWYMESICLTRKLKAGDLVLLQSPPNFLIRRAGCRFLERQKLRGVRFVYIVHDIGELREANATSKGLSRMLFFATVRVCEKIIVHNEAMKNWCVKQGIHSKQLMVLKIFDYLIEESAAHQMVSGRGEFNAENATSCEIAIAGNLSEVKAPYIRDLSSVAEVRWRLYGPNYVVPLSGFSPTITYCGSVPPDVLPTVLSGAFGLVWDGNSVETCSSATGEYLRYNNPHKLSLYLACGVPVIIWDDAAEAQFVREEHVGFTVRSLKEIPAKLRTLDAFAYRTMLENACRLSKQLRRGEYTKRILLGIIGVQG